MPAPNGKKQRTHKRRGPRYWVVAITAMGALVAYCPSNSHNIVLGKTRFRDKTIASEQQRQIKFDIPANTLESVLDKFQRAADIQVIIPDDAMRSLASPGVAGLYNTDPALRAIIRCTCVRYSISDYKHVTLA